jgi:hypothetical protein
VSIVTATNVNINFGQGLNTKVDPYQVPIGQFLSLQNSVFQKGGLLSKRNGYQPIAGAPISSAYLTTLNNNLLAIGDTISAEVKSLDTFVTKGNLQPCSISVSPLIRNNLNQIQTDSAIANGLICVTYSQQNNTSESEITDYLYAVQDSVTEQNIVVPTSIPVLAGGTINGSSRVFIVGKFFVIISPVMISGTTFLQYFSIPLITPSNPSPAQNTFTEAYVPLSGNPGWDASILTNNTIVIAYNTTSGGQGIHVTSLTEPQIAANQDSGVTHSFTGSTFKAGVLSTCVDLTVTPNIVYISFWNPATSNGYTCAVYTGFGTITTQFVPQEIITSETVSNLASSAQNGSALIYSEIANFYSYDNTVPTNFVNSVSVSETGVVGSTITVIRSAGLASKAFLINGISYFLAAFQSPFQPSYFLINGSISTEASPIIVAKLAYQNGGGYLTLGLPNVTVIGSVGSVSYLYKQDVEALNTLNNPQQTTAGGIYSQLGINLVSFEIGTQNIDSAEIGQDLHLSGGFLAMFDGLFPVEHNFFVWPDSIETTYTESSAVTPTGTFASGAFTIVLSDATGVFPGMSVIDSTNSGYILAGTSIIFVNGTTITIDKATTHAGSGDTLSIQGNIAAQPDGSTNTNAYFYQVTYEWTDAKGNPFRSTPSIPVSVTTSSSGTEGTIAIHVPTLRLTQKIFNVVKIVIYRWSVETQVYNQVTSITAPVLNDTTIDSVTFVDTLPDADVVGNNILYTTGGVVPDVNGPASNIISLFDTRLWLVDAEDPNLLWVSKSVIEGTPVEMSLLFTIYIAPNTGTTQSSGPITALFPMDDKLILFKENTIFYINGTGPDNLGTTSVGCPLGQYSPPIFITAVVGCTNQQSIVLTSNGLMFQSDKGIWLLGRDLSTQYIGAPVEAFNSSSVTSANVIPGTNFVLFTLNTDVILMYDYYYGQWGTWNGPGNIISSCIYNGLHTILTSFGQVLQQTPGSYSDNTNPVLMQFATSWLNLATLQGYERFYEMYLLATFLSPHTMEVQVAYDYNSSIYHQSTITPLNFSPSVPSSFGVPTPFGSVPQLEQWRVHAKKQLCQSFQISIQEVFNPAYGTIPGAGFTMSGINCEVEIKRATRPIAGRFASG